MGNNFSNVTLPVSDSINMIPTKNKGTDSGQKRRRPEFNLDDDIFGEIDSNED